MRYGYCCFCAIEGMISAFTIPLFSVYIAIFISSKKHCVSYNCFFKHLTVLTIDAAFSVFFASLSYLEKLS